MIERGVWALFKKSGVLGIRQGVVWMKGIRREAGDKYIDLFKFYSHEEMKVFFRTGDRSLLS